MTELARLPFDDDQQTEPRISYVVARLERAIRKAINEGVRRHG